MEEKQVFDPEQGASLTNTAEEPVDDPRRHVGLEAGGRRGPGTCPDHDCLEEQKNGHATEEACQDHYDDATRPDGEEVAYNGSLDSSLGQAPFSNN